jgi:hypothetical protein
MNYGITLTIEGKAINILRFSIEYFHPSHYDPALMDDATLAFYKKLGVVNREYEPPTHLTLDDLNRNLSYYRFKPCAEPLDGRFRITHGIDGRRRPVLFRAENRKIHARRF